MAVLIIRSFKNLWLTSSNVSRPNFKQKKNRIITYYYFLDIGKEHCMLLKYKGLNIWKKKKVLTFAPKKYKGLPCLFWQTQSGHLIREDSMDCKSKNSTVYKKLVVLVTFQLLCQSFSICLLISLLVLEFHFHLNNVWF